MLNLSILGLSKKSSLPPSIFRPVVQRVDFLRLICSSSKRVVDCSLKNTKRLIDEAKEAYRLMDARERRANHYQILQNIHR